MGEIQSFSEEHANGVAELFFRAMRGRTRPPGEKLPKYFSELLLANPWASTDIPSLVYIEKGKITGSLGVIPRTMEFRGQTIRMATTTQFMVDPDHRRGPAAPQLLRRCFQGPQDISWTDGAVESVNGLWTAMGGHTAPLYSFNWIRILRPLETALKGLERVGGSLRSWHGILRPLARPLDRIVTRLPVSIASAPDSPYSSKMVSADELWECIQEIGWRESLKPSYDRASFSWLMSQAAKARVGDLNMVTVANSEGLLCGWFVCYSKPGDASIVLQIGVRRRDQFENTLRTLFQHAWQRGATCVKGQSMPQYLTSLTTQNCIFRHPSSATLVHSRNLDITNAFRFGEAAISRLDGECWLQFFPAEHWE